MAKKKAANKKVTRKKVARKRAVKKRMDSEDEEEAISMVAPEWMAEDESARKKYEELAPILGESARVTKIHEDNLVTYCEQWAKSRSFTKMILDSGSVLTSPATGGMYAHPAENLLKSALSEMAKQLKIMGLEIDQLEKSHGSAKPPAPKPGGPARFAR